MITGPRTEARKAESVSSESAVRVAIAIDSSNSFDAKSRPDSFSRRRQHRRVQCRSQYALPR